MRNPLSLIKIQSENMQHEFYLANCDSCMFSSDQ